MLLIIAAAPALAQRAPEPTTPAIKLAAATGKVAGSAAYCNFDPKLLEEFISIAKARIVLESQDKIDRVLAELEFSNNHSLAASNEPAAGCEAFLEAMPGEFSKLTE